MADNQVQLDALKVDLPPEEFAEYLEEATVPSGKNFSADHNGLVRFLEKCHDLRDWKDGPGGGGGSGSGGGKWIGDQFEAAKLTIAKFRQDPDAVFGCAHPHTAYLFANRRANRMKVLVHDGIGIWLAAIRLHQGHFVWPALSAQTQISLSRAQLDALVLGLPWSRIGEGGIIRVV